jgi:hypothetical protein
VLPPVFGRDVPPFSVEEVRELYDPRSNFDLHWPLRDGSRRLPLFHTQEDVDTLRAAWWSAVVAHPGTYAKHRAVLFLSQLGMLPDTPLYGVHFNVEEDYWYRGPQVFGMPHNAWVVDVLWEERGSVIFHPWLYVLLTIGAVAFAFRTRSRHRLPILMMGVSALAYFAPYLLIGVAADYRYVWWPVLAGLMSVLMVFDGLGGERSSPAAAKPA